MIKTHLPMANLAGLGRSSGRISFSFTYSAHLGVSSNGGTPTMVGYKGKSQSKLDDD